MSWNEPGGNKRDPWSGRDPQDGPPDLDEVMKNLEEKLRKIFGGKSPNGGGRGSSFTALGLIVLIGLGVWAISGIYLVDEGSRGVVTRFGEYLDTTMPGLHWHFPFPVENKEIVNIDQQRFLEIGYRSGGRQQSLGSVPKEALMLTQDENIIDIRLAVQYQVKDPKAYLFNVEQPDATLKQVIESAQRAVIGKNTMDFILTEGRGEIPVQIKSEIQRILDQYGTGIRIGNVSLVDAQPPEDVQSAFEDAIKAREDEQRLKNEAEAYANEVVPKARGAAARLMEESEAYKQRAVSHAEGEASRFKQLLMAYEKAPEVTRERMYLEVIQEVLAETGTVLVDVKGSNNVFYLPLDRLEHLTLPVTDKEAQQSQSAVPETLDTEEHHARSVSSRGRQGRR